MGGKRGPKQLEPSTVQEIRRLYETDDYTQERLAAMFGLSQSTICKIVNNYIHKDVPMISVGGTANVKVGYRHGDQR